MWLASFSVWKGNILKLNSEKAKNIVVVIVVVYLIEIYFV